VSLGVISVVKALNQFVVIHGAEHFFERFHAAKEMEWK
jgi:hypothetical protein